MWHRTPCDEIAGHPSREMETAAAGDDGLWRSDRNQRLQFPSPGTESPVTSPAEQNAEWLLTQQTHAAGQGPPALVIGFPT